MAVCDGCGCQITGPMGLAGVRYCQSCIRINVQRSTMMAAGVQASASKVARARADEADRIQLSTESLIPDEDRERTGMVTATCIFGAHPGKDIMTAWRDLIGGRAASAERVFADATDACLADLRRKGPALTTAVVLRHTFMAGISTGG